MLFDLTVGDVEGIIELLSLCNAEVAHEFDDIIRVLPTMAIAKEEGKVIGCCWFILRNHATEPRKGPFAEIIYLCVHPDYRKKGYGDFLMIDVCREIGKMNIKRTIVTTGIPDYFIRYGFVEVIKLDTLKKVLMERITQ
jgi:N-acetylglutamate synthase-like GNAT family acetyltransferase